MMNLGTDYGLWQQRNGVMTILLPLVRHTVTIIVEFALIYGRSGFPDISWDFQDEFVGKDFRRIFRKTEKRFVKGV